MNIRVFLKLITVMLLILILQLFSRVEMDFVYAVF